MGYLEFIGYFILTFIIVGNILYVLFFRLIRIIEFLTFAFKVTNNSHNQINRGKKFINPECYTDNRLIDWVKYSFWKDKIKAYARNADDCEYEEQTKQKIPRLFKAFDWLLSKIAITHAPNSSTAKESQQPEGKRT
ncbi:MAG: hypothetical protein PHU23_02670 [Dehalococcoidales bacterium]|nr:hypothetical protein [Dehalococcoidales bacterium]